LAILQGILERAVEWQRISVNPVRVIQKPVVRRLRTIRALPPAVVEEIRSGLEPRDATLVSVLAYSGLRPGEALALTWEDIGERAINVDKALALGEEKDTKNRRTRQVVLLAPLKTDLQEWELASGRREGLVFPMRDGRPWTDTAYRNWRRRNFARAAQAAGIEHPRPYDLRHSFASLLFAERRNPAEIAEQMGHNLQTLLSTYVRVIEELRDADRVNAEDLIRAARAENTAPSRAESQARSSDEAL
jgi:integrase